MFFFPAFSLDSFLALLFCSFREAFLEVSSAEPVLFEVVVLPSDGLFSISDLLPIGPLPNSGLP